MSTVTEIAERVVQEAYGDEAGKNAEATLRKVIRAETQDGDTPHDLFTLIEAAVRAGVDDAVLQYRAHPAWAICSGGLIADSSDGVVTIDLDWIDDGDADDVPDLESLEGQYHIVTLANQNGGGWTHYVHALREYLIAGYDMEDRLAGERVPRIWDDEAKRLHKQITILKTQEGKDLARAALATMGFDIEGSASSQHYIDTGFYLEITDREDKSWPAPADH